MVGSRDMFFDLPERLYNSPEELHRDVRRISNEMARIDSMLALHNLRISLIGEESPEQLRQKIIALKEAVDDADKALRLLTRFSAAVSELSRELDNIRCISGD